MSFSKLALGLYIPLALAMLSVAGADELETIVPSIEYGQPRQLAIVSDKRIDESSGVTRSVLNHGMFWTHNDSGDFPRLFLINTQGQTVGTFHIRAAGAWDWEDICSFQLGETGYLLIGDVGDNPSKRKRYTLYLCREPVVDSSQASSSGKPPHGSISVRKAIVFTYEDGPRNCESIAVDVGLRKIYLVSKVLRQSICHVYELPLPTEDLDDVLIARPLTEPLVARRIATLKIPTTVGMDVSPDGHRAIIRTHAEAYQYTRRSDQSWATAFAGRPREIKMPRQVQGESICYGADGKTLYLTSESIEQPLWEVPVVTTEGEKQR